MFLDLLYEWSEEGSRLYKSVTWVYKKNGEKLYANYAAQSREEFIRLIESRIARNTDVYVALGTQRECGEGLSVDGFPKAKRKKDNIVSFKSIWLDIDAGKPGGYADTNEALGGLRLMLEDMGGEFPAPSMIVFSGSGGFHAYWCTNTTMTVDQWHTLAWGLRNAALHHGLKFDPQVTVNVPGILRVPGSMNFKQETPTPVQLGRLTANTYSYDYLHALLSRYESIHPRPLLQLSKPVLTEKAKNFTDNVVTIAPRISLDAVEAVCPTVRDVLSRGGAGDPEPLWSQMIYLAACTDDPPTSAIRLSYADSRFTEAETMQKLEQKIQIKESTNMGWPLCQTISNECTTCANCPLLAAGKSPLFFAMRHMRQVAPPVQPTGLAGAPASPPAGSVASLIPPGGGGGGGGGGEGGGSSTPPPPNVNPDLIMPEGYWRDTSSNIVCTTMHDKKGDAYVASFFHYPVDDAWIDTNTNELVFLTRVVDNHPRYVAIGAGATASKATLAAALGTQGSIVVENQTETMRFFVAWIKHIQGLRGRKGITASALGWQQGNKSFTYGGYTHAESGQEVAYVKNVDDRFMPKGDIKYWTEAAELIYGNPALEVLVASSFAAPLVGMHNNYSCVLAAHSYESGHGKTTALQIAQAVWGHPITSMSALSDTLNAIMEKVATLQSLPSYWDELKTEQDNAAVIDIIFQVTGGKGKARLKQDGTPMAVKPFSTMFVTASNKRVLNIALKQTKNTNAGGIRVFEAEVPQMTTTQSQHSAAQRLKMLSDNYGRPGEAYAKWITKNHKTVIGIIEAIDKNLSSLNFSQSERFWSTTMTTLLSAAYITNAMGMTKFDVAKMQAYLVDCLRKMRSTLSTGHSSAMNKANAKEILAQMTNDISTTSLIVTDFIPAPLVGRHTVQMAKMINPPIRPGVIWMHRGKKDGRVRALRSSFNEWLDAKGYDPDKIIRDLESFYKIEPKKLTLGTRVQGWPAPSQQQWCYEMIPLSMTAVRDKEDDDEVDEPTS